VEAWPAQQVLEQIRSIAQQGYREIFFRDETFSAFPLRNREVFEGLLRLGSEVSWICNVKPGTTTLEDLKLMKRAGCRLVKVGVESGSRQVLEQSGKGISADTTRRLMADIHHVDLASHAHVMLGMPGDTVESIEETMMFVLELEPTTLDVGICTPLPGSELWNLVCAAHPEGIDVQRIEAAELHTIPVMSNSYCGVDAAQLERSVRRLYRRFYLRPGYLWQRAAGVHSMRGLCDLARYGLSVTRFMF
jgi:tRNA A37 methylthiotransferase MiaB